MSSNDQQHQAQRIEFQERIVRSQNWTTCLNCEHWQEVTTVKGQEDAKKEKGCSKYGVVPPPEVLVHGCPEWDGEIPF